ncbi:MAG: GrpB family protein [Sporichthyaceae bacterium]
MTDDQAGDAAAISLSPYDPHWVVLFEDERASLEVALADWLVGPVEHIGSTSVPGLAAKPIIDMMAPVRSLTQAAAAIEAVTALGYRHGVHRPEEAHYFSRPDTDHWWERTHQLHLTEPTSLLWRRRIAFRDALRRRADQRARYVQLKHDLAQAHGSDLTAYARDKDDFVNDVLGVRDTSEAPPRDDPTHARDVQTGATAGVVLADPHGRVLLPLSRECCHAGQTRRPLISIVRCSSHATSRPALGLLSRVRPDPGRARRTTARG